MKRVKITILFAFIGLFLLTSCRSKTQNNQPISADQNPIVSTSNNHKPKIVTTVGMIADVAKNIASDCAEVSALMGPGIDPHLYKASARDVRHLQYANLILYSGYHLEGKLAEVLEKFTEDQKAAAVAEQAISLEKIINSFQGRTTPDPHVWMDVSQWAGTIGIIKEELIKLVPACEEDIVKRSEDYGLELNALHNWIKQSLASIPQSKRVLVTAHDAFAYYGRAYGLKVIGIQGISTASEASLADIRDTVSIIVEKKIPAIFVESSINPRTIMAVKAAVQDRGFDVKNGGQLFSDAMGQGGTADGTYIGMLYNNTKVITIALGGKPPELPKELDNWAKRWGLK